MKKLFFVALLPFCLNAMDDEHLKQSINLSFGIQQQQAASPRVVPEHVVPQHIQIPTSPREQAPALQLIPLQKNNQQQSVQQQPQLQQTLQKQQSSQALQFSYAVLGWCQCEVVSYAKSILYLGTQNLGDMFLRSVQRHLLPEPLKKSWIIRNVCAYARSAIVDACMQESYPEVLVPQPCTTKIEYLRRNVALWYLFEWKIQGKQPSVLDVCLKCLDDLVNYLFYKMYVYPF